MIEVQRLGAQRQSRPADAESPAPRNPKVSPEPRNPKSLRPVLPAKLLSLREVHWSALQFAERQLWTDLMDDVLKLWTRP